MSALLNLVEMKQGNGVTRHGDVESRRNEGKNEEV